MRTGRRSLAKESLCPERLNPCPPPEGEVCRMLWIVVSIVVPCFINESVVYFMNMDEGR